MIVSRFASRGGNIGNRDPIEHRLRLADTLLNRRTAWSADVGYEGIVKPASPALYVPYAQSNVFPAWWIAERGTIAPPRR
jgi:hypothetical protein